jgi:hypothetical protein
MEKRTDRAIAPTRPPPSGEESCPRARRDGGDGGHREVVYELEKFKGQLRNIKFPLDKGVIMCYNLDQVGKEIKLWFTFSTGKDGTMSLALDQGRRMALRSAGRETVTPKAQDSAPARAYRAACARCECERRLHLARRRNLTNPVLNGTAL